MWLARWILALAIIVLALLFGWMNIEQMSTDVTFNFLLFQTESPLIMALFVSFLIGAIAWFPVAISQYIQSKTEIRNLRRVNNHLQKELGDLRNMSIEEYEIAQKGAEDNE